MEGGDFDMVLLENVECDTKEQLHARERYHIESLDCVNIKHPTRSNMEYYEANKETIREAQKKYRETHREVYRKSSNKYYETHNEKIKAKAAEQVSCGCGSAVRNCGVTRHNKSKKHQA
eukprot:16521-Eustigmatos_ZCMA.PRE.1